METKIVKLADIKPAPYNPRVQLTEKDQEYKALCIALNKLDGEWDYGQLSEILQQLTEDGENLLATGFTEQDIDDLLGDIRGELDGDDEEPPAKGKKEDDTDGIKCQVGDFKFTLDEAEFEDLMADVREKVGFTQALVCDELKRRLFDEI